MDGTTKMQYSPNSLLRKMVREDMMLFSSGEPLHALYPFPNNDREFSIVRLHPLRDALLVYHRRHVRGLRVRRLQCDEIWAFVGAKAKNVSAEKKAEGWGDAWTRTAIDADTNRTRPR
jgi:hypothetical protein